MKKIAFFLAAVLLCLGLAGCSGSANLPSAPKPNQEVLDAAAQLVATMQDGAQVRPTEEQKQAAYDCFAEDLPQSDQDEIMGEMAAGNLAEQQLISYIGENDGRHLISVVNVLHANEYRDSPHFTESLFVLVKEGDGYKVDRMYESDEEMMMTALVGKDMLKARDEGRNSLYFEGVGLTANREQVIQGNMTELITACYQKADGSFAVAVYLSNGTEKERTSEAVSLSVYYSGGDGQAFSYDYKFEKTLVLAPGEVWYQLIEIPADQVLSGTDPLEDAFPSAFANFDNILFTSVF